MSKNKTNKNPNPQTNRKRTETQKANADTRKTQPEFHFPVGWDGVEATVTR